MRRVPVDADFGAPIAILKGTSISLFENGTLGQYNSTKDDESPILFKPYNLFYNHVSEIRSLSINSSDELPEVFASLQNWKSKTIITLSLGLALLLTYQMSFQYSQLPLINLLSTKIQQVIFLVLAIFIAGIESFLPRYFCKDLILTRTLQINFQHRKEPKLIIENDGSMISFWLNYHNIVTRIVILIGCVSIPSTQNFGTDLDLFIRGLLFANSILYIVIIAFSPLLMINWLWDRYQTKDYVNVSTFGLEDFTDLAIAKVKESKSCPIEEERKSLSELISGDETSTLEFKGSIWTQYDPRNYQPIDAQAKKSMKLQDAIVKSVASFLNTDGGTLLIGVKDKPHLQEYPVVGIENDFKWVKGNDLEGFGHSLIQLLNDAFGDQSTLKLYSSISYPKYNEKTVCRIDIEPLPRNRDGELWVKTKTMGEEEFFYRVSDTTTHASAKSALRYIRHHFEGFSVTTEKNENQENELLD